MAFSNYGKGIAKGMMVTIRHLFRHPITTQYPEQRLTTSGASAAMNWSGTDVKCTGCTTCAKACPQGAIEIVTSVNAERKPV